MNGHKLAIELVSIADDIMAGSRPERTTKELNDGLANWIRAYNQIKLYGNSTAAGVLRMDIDKIVQQKDLDEKMVWEVK